MDITQRLRNHAMPDSSDEREVLHAPLLREAADEIDGLRGLIEECRSSVKFDLNRYERMALDFGRLGMEGAQVHAISEAEAQRLHELLERIDALALKPSNV